MRKHIEDALFEYLPADLKPYLVGLGLLASLGFYLAMMNLEVIIPIAVVALMFPLTALSGYPARFNPFKIDLEFRTTAMIVVAAAFGPVYGAFAGVAFTVVNAVASLIHPDDALPEIMLYGVSGYLIGLLSFTADNFFTLGIMLSVAIMAIRTVLHKMLGDPLGYCIMQFMGSLVWIVLEIRLVFGYALFKILAVHGA
jgi:hypothetical protein